jgi:hypothetical protein
VPGALIGFGHTSTLITLVVLPALHCMAYRQQRAAVVEEAVAESVER